jgi:hypothetical protein
MLRAMALIYFPRSRRICSVSLALRPPRNWMVVVTLRRIVITLISSFCCSDSKGYGGLVASATRILGARRILLIIVLPPRLQLWLEQGEESLYFQCQVSRDLIGEQER